ncbi:hypothetical protein ACIQ7D_28105 [Streptomyces sp. NPDC096310]|uniref:hypothetical protein n=1 Tax=Streptomyces sp. NPDC096310 TaxID=3366082 RepID=UPI0037FD6D0B
MGELVFEFLAGCCGVVVERWRELASAGQFSGDFPPLLDRRLVGVAGSVELVVELAGERLEFGVGKV